MAKLFINWKRDSATLNWYKLRDVDFGYIMGSGVYLIWHGGVCPRAVYVGQGIIAERLKAHQRDPKIMVFEKFGSLFTSWGNVAARNFDGVERFLVEKYAPVVNEVTPIVPRISVNLLI